MAKRPTLKDITVDRLTAVANYNSNNANILASFDNTLSRDGSSPNQMEADFDMNSNKILNAGSVSTAALFLAGQQVQVGDVLTPLPPSSGEDNYYEDVTDDTYGAAGDGVTDDTAAIQAALDTGNTVFLPAGTYLLNGLLTMAADGQVIFGEGRKSRLIQSSTSNLSTGCIQITGNNSVIRDLRLTPNEAWVNFITGFAVDFNGADRGLAYGLYIDDHDKGVLVRNSNYCRVTQCHFETTRFDNSVDDSSRGGQDIMFTYGSSHGLADNNFCRGNSSGIVVQQLTGQGSMYSNIVCNNSVRDCGTYGIVVYRGEAEPSGFLQRTIVHSNIVENIDGGTLSSGQGTRPFGAGIYLQGSLEGICMGNYVRNTNISTVDEQLSPGAIGCTNGINNLVTGNYIEDAQWYGISVFNSNQQGDTTNDWSQVHNNHIVRPQRAGIYGKNVERISVRGNVVTNGAIQGILIAVSVITPNLVHAIVNENTVAGCDQISISVNDVETCVINDNHCTDGGSIGIVAGSENAVVTGNFVKGMSANRGIQINASVTSGVCKANYIADCAQGINCSGVVQGYEDNEIINCTTDYQGIYQPWRSFTDGDTTPSIAGGRTFSTANTSATSITDFDGETSGAQEFTVYVGDTNTTFVQGQLRLNGNTNWTTPPVGSSITFVFYPTGSVWVEKSRMQLS